MNICLKAQLTPEDYAAAQRLYTYGRYRLATIVLTGIAFVVSLLLGGVDNVWGGWLLAVINSALVLAMSVAGLPKVIAMQTAKTFAQQKSLQTPYEIDITDELYHSIHDRGETRIPWRDFHKWKRNEDIILVYQSDRLFHVLLRRWFASDGEFQDFADLLAKTIGPAGKSVKRT